MFLRKHNKKKARVQTPSDFFGDGIPATIAPGIMVATGGMSKPLIRLLHLKKKRINIINRSIMTKHTKIN